jgi:hypothetical protein
LDTDVENWLSHLPLADEYPANGAVLNGWLVSSKARQITILVGEVYLSFHRSDILEIELADSQEITPDPSGKLAVRAIVRRGARLLDIRLVQLDDNLSQQRRPFALAARPLAPVLPPAGRFRDMERQFLLRHSLLVNDSHSV